MADRFPSLEEFDTAQIDAPSVSSFGPASTDDFLSREKALLGDDANQFTTQNDMMAFVPEENNVILGEGFPTIQGGGDEELSAFTSSFPAIDVRNNNIAHTETITDKPESYKPQSHPEELEEPEIIKKWREQRNLTISERAARSEERKQETIKSAQQNIDEFYENYNTKKEKGIAQTRREAEEFLAAREDTSAGGTSWERIAKLVDLSGKGVRGGASGTDKARFRDLLISLKKDPNAPGASGY
ncbi:putative clathrin light chain [Erysiphe necator]|uniref:Clathrin light chain n=1 Tax=Uncinula necator TaxID=52586 RepID=A0A0B1NZI3_UNCNE|nr:putative clathrin light chain [Erysiphe necator]